MRRRQAVSWLIILLVIGYLILISSNLLLNRRADAYRAQRCDKHGNCEHLTADEDDFESKHEITVPGRHTTTESGSMDPNTEISGGLNHTDEQIIIDRLKEASRKRMSQFRFTLKVLTFDRVNSLSRALNSLKKAEYMGDTVDLEVFIDHFSYSSKIADNQKQFEVNVKLMEFLHDFSWPHGRIRIHRRQTNVYTGTQWLEAWWPASSDDFAMFVEDDIEVSPKFYIYAKSLIQRYYYDNPDYSLFGISLQRFRYLLADGKFRRESLMIDDTQLVYSYQALGTWGQIMFPKPWSDFRNWIEGVRVDPDYMPIIDGMETTKWYLSRREKIWTPWFIKFAFIHNMYCLYLNFPGKGALSISHQEAGINTHRKLRPDAELIRTVSRPYFEYDSENTFTRFDFCGRHRRRGRIITKAQDIPAILQDVLNQGIVALVWSQQNPQLLLHWQCASREVKFDTYLAATHDIDIANELAQNGIHVFLIPRSTFTAGLIRATFAIAKLYPVKLIASWAQPSDSVQVSRLMDPTLTRYFDGLVYVSDGKLSLDEKRLNAMDATTPAYKALFEVFVPDEGPYKDISHVLGEDDDVITELRRSKRWLYNDLEATCARVRC